MANQHPKNLIHVVFDNECYESSRGAPTATAGQADLAAIARGAGFANVITTKTIAEFEQGFSRALKSNDLYFILAKVEAGAGDVPAAALDSQENKYIFVRYIEKSENLKNPHFDTIARQRRRREVELKAGIQASARPAVKARTRSDRLST